MLVIISDLHFTDGTTSNWKKKEDLFNINPRAFKLFLSRISDIVERRNISDVHFVYNGDIFDPLRTHAWFDIDASEHPWAIPLNSEKVRDHTKKILENIIDNPCNRTSLQWLNGTHEDFTKVWKQSDSDVTVRRTYIPGNHDRIINLYPDCRGLVYERLLNVSAEEGRFENLYFEVRQPFAIGAALLFRHEIAPLHFALTAIIIEIKGAVFPDNTVHRPHAGDVVAPARRPTGNGNHANVGCLDTLHGGKHDGRQPTIERQGVINIRQNVSKAIFDRFGHFSDCFHQSTPEVFLRYIR